MKSNRHIMIYLNSMNAAGGIERVVTNLLELWCRDYKITLVLKDNGKTFFIIPDNVNVIAMNTSIELDMNNKLQRIITLISSWIGCRKKLKVIDSQFDFDYIYTTTPFNALEIFTLKRNIRKKMVVSEHGSSYGYNKVYKLIKRLIYPRVYCVSVPNKMDTQLYKSWKSNAVYVPHIFEKELGEKNSLETKIILNIGRLTKDKQQNKLLEIWSQIEEKKGWKLWIVGDGEEKTNIENMINTLHLENEVKLIPATSQIDEIYKKASFFAFTSRYEGFGMVLLEAMSFGIPCIAFDCPSGPRDVIEHKINGYLIENNNVEQYIQSLLDVIDMDDDELKRMGKAARNTVENWNNKKIAVKWKNIFK